ncbi:hypothetical protein BVC93_21795 [Mycobacterium sp. MS1601]|nr:hypothetical protein BVC93_21795 [Mycobacterium sp. MS1601]
MMTPTQGLLAYMSAFEELDLNGLFAMFDDHLTMRFPYIVDGYPKELQGRSQCEGFLSSVAAIFRQVRWVKRDVYSTSDPELAMAIAESSVILSGGGTYTNDYVLLLRMREGKIIEYTEYFDPNRAHSVFSAAAG